MDNDGDLKKIAAPRIGRVKLVEPDNVPYYRFSKRRKFFFFGSNGVPLFKITVGGLLVHDGTNALQVPTGKTGPPLVSVRIDNFLSQNVLCLNEEWVKRGDVIKYIANVGHGVHSGMTKTNEEKLIEKIRKVATYTQNPPNVPLGIKLNWDAIATEADPPFRYAPTEIDVVLVELLAAAHFLVSSPDIIELERVITEELTNPS